MIEDQLSRKWNKFFNHRHPPQLRCQGETITILNYYSITWYLEYKKAQNVEFWAQFKWLASWLQKLQLPLMVFPTVIDEHDSDDKAIAIVDMWMCGLRITSILQFANYPKMCAALNDFVQRIACPAEMQILGQIASGSKLWPEWASLMQCNEPRNCSSPVLQPSIATQYCSIAGEVHSNTAIPPIAAGEKRTGASIRLQSAIRPVSIAIAASMYNCTCVHCNCCRKCSIFNRYFKILPASLLNHHQSTSHHPVKQSVM